MQIKPSQLGEQPRAVPISLEEDWLKGLLAGHRATEFRVRGGHPIEIQAQRLGLDVLLRADFRLHLRTDCSLCLRGFELEVPVHFTLTLQPEAGRNTELPAEMELSPEDLEEYRYSSDLIDLEEILREQIILALPMYPRCSDTCNGLCHVCGVNLNEETCSCERENMDPRWAKLKTLTKN